VKTAGQVAENGGGMGAERPKKAKSQRQHKKNNGVKGILNAAKKPKNPSDNNQVAKVPTKKAARASFSYPKGEKRLS